MSESFYLELHWRIDSFSLFQFLLPLHLLLSFPVFVPVFSLVSTSVLQQRAPSTHTSIGPLRQFILSHSDRTGVSAGVGRRLKT